ncbi:MAG: FAD-binding oxidoreductase [Alphaproteobacteria bacterium]
MDIKWTCDSDLRPFVRGNVILPQDSAYDATRAVWNSMIDRRPLAIVRCADTADVMAALRFARDHAMSVSVRGGGHNVAGSAVCDDGLMIDLSLMRAVIVDPDRRVAIVQGGATLGDLDHATQAFGLATPGGVVSTTGVGGLTLGGGFGWLSRKHGLAVDNLISVGVVTADGSYRRASDDENPDLFWAVRGGGGNFGVAVALEFKLHPVGPDVLFGPTLWRIDEAAAVLRRYRDFARAAPRECSVWADLLTAPPLPILPQRFHGTKVLSLMQCHVGPPTEGERVLAPLRTFGEPIGDGVAMRPYAGAQAFLDSAYDRGARNYWSTMNAADLADPLPELLVELAATMPSAESDILVSLLGGAIADVPADSTAYPHRDSMFAITPGARWRDAQDDEACLAWIRSAADALAPLGNDLAYVNFVSEAAGRERAAYGANYRRLAAIKAEYDPENRFRWGQNIRPGQMWGDADVPA